jgi:hypothetical protein
MNDQPKQTVSPDCEIAEIELLPPQTSQKDDVDNGGGTPSAQEIVPSIDLQDAPATSDGSKLELAKCEARLPDQLASESGRQPFLNTLLVSQLAGSVPEWLTKVENVDGSVELYRKLQPQDGIETVLAGLVVGLFNASMDGFERANRSGLTPDVRQMELKLSQSGTAQLTNVIKTLQAHRGLGNQQVNVGSVNVSSGANAIVGNVSPPKRS